MAVESVVLMTRWIARVCSVASILFVMVFAVGEFGGGNGLSPSFREWVGLALWPVGVGAGLILAWYREIQGGMVALACLFAFYAWNFLHSGKLPQGPLFLLMAAPGFLFLIAGCLSRYKDNA